MAKIRFCDGPLDGTEIECQKAVDKVLIVFDDEVTVLRYECDVIETLPEYAAGNQAPDCILHETHDAGSFDEEVIDAIGE